MAIGADSLILFAGTQDQVDTTSSAVTDGSYSVAADTSLWTNDDDAPMASFVLTTDSTQTTPGAAEKVVLLYTRLMNINSTADEPAPDANYAGHYLGAFVFDNAAGVQDVPLTPGVVNLPNQYASQVHEFYVRNELGVTLAATWELRVTPLTVGPHA